MSSRAPVSFLTDVLRAKTGIMMDAILDPPREEHQTMLDWYGGPFDPIGLDKARARLGMDNMARRQRCPLASHRSESRRPKG